MNALVGVLGPVVLHPDRTDGGIPVASKRARALLVSLALSHPSPVTVDALVADAWPDRPPQNPAAAVHTQISRLRTLLGAAAVISEPGRYRLSSAPPPAPAVSDLTLALTLSTAIDNDISPDTFRRGLKLWRGVPGADLHPGPLRERLEAAAASVHRRLQHGDWQARLQVDPAVVVDEIEAELAVSPLDERLTALQMRAAIASGDPNRALQIHARLAVDLADTLGADPGPAVAAAHAAALAYSPLPHAPSPPGNDFVGGTTTIAELSAALARAPVVTLLGPGGIGKSRLVSEFVAGRSHPHLFIDLASAVDPEDVTAVVAATVGRGSLPGSVADTGRTAPAADTPAAAGAAIARMAPAELLVVLDSCEHTPMAAIELIDGLRTQRTDVSVIATSRTALAIPGVVTVTVAPLPPEAAAILFSRRARSVRADSHLDPHSVAELCRRLDGSPLALELAAAQLRHLTLGDLLSRLDRRFEILAVGHSDTTEHSVALADVVAASWELLPTHARTTLRVVCWFSGDIRLDDALTLDGVSIDGLASLCEHSLATVIESTEATSYRITETVRAFGREIANAAEQQRIHRDLERWASTVVDAAVADIAAGRVVTGTRQLDRCADDLLAILDRAARCATSDSTAPNSSPPGGTELTASAAVQRLLPIVGWRWVRTGGHPGTAPLARTALSASPETDTPIGLACAAAYLAALGQLRDAARARIRLRRLLLAPTATPAIRTLLAPLLTGTPRQAARSLSAATRSNDPAVTATAELLRADAAERYGNPTLTQRSALRALVAAELAEHPWLTATARHRLGRVRSQLGDHPQAAVHFGRSAIEFAAIGFAEDACRVRIHQALALARSAPADAYGLLEQCLREVGDSTRPYAATAHAVNAQLALSTDPRPSAARAHAEHAVEIVGPPRDGHSVHIHAVRLAVLHHTGAHTRAVVQAQQFGAAVSMLANAPVAVIDLPSLGAAAAALALVGGPRGRPADAQRYARAACGLHHRQDFAVLDLPPQHTRYSRAAALRILANSM